jgi:serine/threonine protein kinase
MSEPLRPGDPAHLGRYELMGRLGAGGMGTVFLGRAPENERLVAIKVVRPEFVSDDEFRGRFRSEVNRARQVPPFSTAEVLDADPDHEPPYLVVEYVDGPSLAVVIKERGPLSGAALHGVAVGIATALTAIHGAGVIHRDLKPGNVLVAPGGIKVIDFGIAQAFEATSQHTKTDQMVGTVAYMAPERFDPAYGSQVTAAADVFAWGAVVAYAAAGRTPFGGDSAPATAMRILTQPPDLSGVPASLRDAVGLALSKQPGDRPTARQLLDMLLAGAAAVPFAPAVPVPPAAAAVVPPPDDVPPPPPPRRRPGLLIAAVTAVAAVALGGAGLVMRNQLNTSESTTPAAGGPSAVPSVRPSVDVHAAILGGRHQAIIHVAEIDRDLALDVHDEAVLAADGTGQKSLFALVPYGVDFMIRTLRDAAETEQTCVGVKVVPDSDSKLVPTECSPTQATLFTLSPTPAKDDKGRPTYHLYNDTYGFVQWAEDRKIIYVDFVGDASPSSSFSFVDRGLLPTPTPK